MALAVDRRRAARYLLVITCLAVVIVVSPPGYLLGFLEDDAAFYAVISNNFAHGFGSTFDRISLTNGYHPLWMLILSSYLWLLRPFFDTLQGAPEITLRLLMIFQAALYLAGLWLSIDIIGRLAPNISRAALALFVVAYLIALKQNFLLETGISLLLMLSIVKLLLGSTPHQELKLSFLFGLWVLARLDQALAVALISFYVARSRTRDYKGFLKTLLTLGAVPLLLLIAYLVSNYLLFGHFYTISSLVKSRPFSPSLGAIWSSLTVQFDPRNPRVALLFLSVVTTLPLVTIMVRRHRGRAFNLLLVFFGAQLVTLLVDAAFLWEIRAWYYILPATLGYMLWAAAANDLFLRFAPPLSRRLEAGTLIALVALSLGYAYITTTYTAIEAYQWEFFREVARQTPEDAVIYCIDTSGKASLVTNRRLINGDGLVNSFEYIEDARSGSLDHYFRYAKPNYYLETRSLADQPVRFSGQALSADFLVINHFEFAATDLVVWEDRIPGRIYALYRFDSSIHYTSGRMEP